QPLERVHRAEGVVDQLVIDPRAGALLERGVEREQVARQALDDLLRLADEFVALVDHDALIAPRGRCRTGIRRAPPPVGRGGCRARAAGAPARGRAGPRARRAWRGSCRRRARCRVACRAPTTAWR